MTSPIQLALQANQQSAQTNSSIRQDTKDAGIKAFGEDGLTFADLIDIINPLHHIPIIGNLYRKLTGDEIDPAIRIAGGALFGGPIGVGLSAVSVAFEMAAKDNKDADSLLDDQHQNMPLDVNQAIAKKSSTNPGREIVETAYGLRSISRSRKSSVDDQNQNMLLDANQMIARKFSTNLGKGVVETAYGLKSIPRGELSLVVTVGSGVEPLSTNAIINSENRHQG